MAGTSSTWACSRKRAATRAPCFSVRSADASRSSSLRSRSQATYANGYLLFIRDRTLWAQPFDVEREALGGAPVAVARDVLEDPTIWRGIFSVSDTGTLVYEGGVAGTSLTLYDRAGHEVGPVGERGIIFDVNVSPDGSRVAVNRGDPADIWVYELERGTSLRLTFDVRNETMPVWSPDGRQLAFNQVQREAKNAVLGIPASGGASRELIPSGDLQITDWSSNGRVMLLRQGELIDEPGRHLGAAAGRPAAGAAADAVCRVPCAFLTRHAMGELRVERVGPRRGVRDAVCHAGARRHRARRRRRSRPRLDGRRRAAALAPRRAGAVLPVPGHAGDGGVGTRGGHEARRAEASTPLFPLNPKPVGWVFDVMPDGQRFVVNSLGDEGRRPLALVTNWPSSLAPGN